MSAESDISDSDSPVKSCSSTSSRRSLKAARMKQDKVVSKTMRPKFLKLFAEEDKPAVIAKLTAYHLRMGTDMFLGLSDYVRYHMIVRSRIPGHDYIRSVAKNWSMHDMRRFAHIGSIWPDFQRLSAAKTDPAISTSTQTDGEPVSLVR